MQVNGYKLLTVIRTSSPKDSGEFVMRKPLKPKDLVLNVQVGIFVGSREFRIVCYIIFTINRCGGSV